MTDAASPLSPWFAHLVRLTIFLGAPFDATGQWNRVAGEQPELDENRPREAVRRQAGPVGEGYLELRANQFRIDWLLTAPPPRGMEPRDPHFFAEVDKGLRQLWQLLTPWLSECSGMRAKRLAFGLIAVQSTPTREVAYRRLQELLTSVRLNAENSTEFFYQINHPKPSRALPGEKLNRLTRWCAVKPVEMIIAFDMGASQRSIEAMPRSELEYVQCECDNSTSADRASDLDPQLLVPIYEELQGMALDNLERGELS